MKVLRLASLLVAGSLACGSLRDGPAAGAPSPSATGSARSGPTAPESASPSRPATVFPDLPLIVGTPTGDIFFALTAGAPSGPKIHVCGSAVNGIATFGRQAAVACNDGLYLWDEATGRVTPIVGGEARMAAFDGQGRLAYVTLGAEVPTAPISMTKLLLRDLRTGATTTIDERFGVAFELRTTGEGVAVWRPKNNLSFMRPDAESGTWLIRGTGLVRLSAHRLIAGAAGQDLLESEPSPGSGGATYVVWKTATETRLTPPGVANERALAIARDGRVVAWRPASDEFHGAVVVYRGTTVERTDAGRFSAFGAVTDGEWIVGLEHSGPPSLTLHAYRIADGTFASVPASGVSALALLAPKK